jgi:serine/threonine-protein phosphatase 5
VDHSHDEAAETKGLELKNQGNQELIQGHFLKAIRLYSEALEYSPKNAIILANRAQAYIKVENYGLAIVDATHAIQLDKNYAKGYYRRASAYFALNKYKLARKDFRKVVTLKPKDRDARIKLAECEKAVKEEAFLMAIVSEATAPLSSTYNVDALIIDANYNGPLLTTTTTMGPTDFDKQHSDDQALFQPGKLPLDFVMVRFYMCNIETTVSYTLQLLTLILYIGLSILYRRVCRDSRIKRLFTSVMWQGC